MLDIVHEVCAEWNTEFPSLMAPKQKIELSLFGIKNNRRKMEDRHALCVDVNSLFSLKVAKLFLLLTKFQHGLISKLKVFK